MINNYISTIQVKPLCNDCRGLAKGTAGVGSRRRGDYFLFRIVALHAMLYGCPVADMALHVGQQLRTSTCPWLPNSLSHAYTTIRLSARLPIKHHTTRTCIIHLQQFAHEKQEEFLHMQRS